MTQETLEALAEAEAALVQVDLQDCLEGIARLEESRRAADDAGRELADAERFLADAEDRLARRLRHVMGLAGLH